MNYNKLFIASFLSILLMVVGCSKDETVIKESSKIDTKDILLSLEAGKETISFYAADAWTASLSTTSWIKIDPTTRAGEAGDSKVIIEWDKNTNIKERVADLTIAVKGENPVKIRLIQFPESPMLTVDKQELNLVVKPAAGNGKGLFVDTISVKSNIKWAIKNIPAWIEYSTVGDKEPQEGVSTDIQLIISANPAKFDQTVMSATIQLGQKDNADLDVALQISAETSIKAIGANNAEISSLQLEYSSGTGNQYAASFNLVSNTSWKLAECPQWLQPSKTDNAQEYAASLNTNIKFWFHVQTADLDTEALKGNVVFVNEKTKTSLSLEVVFPGTGMNYFENNIMLNPDAPFKASQYDENWTPIPGATSVDFDMYTAVDYASLNEAPFTVHFVSSNYGIALNKPATWADVEIAQEFKTGKSPLVSKKLTLFVHDRNDMEMNPYEKRFAYMIVTPKNVTFDDLFDQAGKLKAEYENVAKLFGQEGKARPPFNSEIPDEVQFTAKGGEFKYMIISGPEFLNSQVEDQSWLSVNFEWTDNFELKAVVKAQPNTTGKSRFQTVQLTEWVEATQSEDVVFEFIVTQAAE
ncbi:MAG: BACON domain-containing protein [Bacteroidales bacterium]